MFDEKLLNEYKSIAAPPQLRERVMSYAKHPQKTTPSMLRGLAAAAACFVMIFAIYMVSDFRATGGISISVNGERLTSESVVLESENAVMMARMLDVYTVPMTFELEKESEISVSDGEITISDAESGETQTGTVLKAAGETEIYWNIYPNGQSAEYEMVVENNKERCTIVLAYDTAENTYTICCE